MPLQHHIDGPQAAFEPLDPPAYSDWLAKRARRPQAVQQRPDQPQQDGRLIPHVFKTCRLFRSTEAERQKKKKKNEKKKKTTTKTKKKEKEKKTKTKKKEEEKKKERKQRKKERKKEKCINNKLIV